MNMRSPIGRGAERLRLAVHSVGEASQAVYRVERRRDAARPAVRRIGAAELGNILARGFADFGAYRSDVIFLCLLYPLLGLVIERLAFEDEMLPLLFPIASGFALVGPIAALGLYEMSRRREQGGDISWADAFGVFRSPSLGAISVLALLLIGLYLAWLFAAAAIYRVALGPEPPASLQAFLRDVFTTGAGWAMVGAGVGVGLLFAVLAFAISVIAAPLLLDRPVGVATAIWTSIRVVAMNPGPMILWGAIVTAGLVIGAIPFFVGLIIVLPVLGHATWHLHRRLVPR